MKIIGALLKFFLGLMLLGTIVIAGIFAYFTTFGKGMLERSLSGLLGSGIKFKTVSVDIASSAVHFKGITIDSQIGLEPNVFNADTFTLKLDKQALQTQKKIVVDELLIENASLNILRARDGKISLMLPTKEKTEGAFGMKDEGLYEKNGLYELVNAVRKISVKNSVVRFWDHMVSSDAFLVMCENLEIDMITDSQEGNSLGYVKVNFRSTFNVYNRPYPPGLVQIDADIKVYKPFVEAVIGLTAGNIDVSHIKPYLDAYTPFIFNRGVFTANLQAGISSSGINALTTINFHSVNVAVNPAKENSEFLQTSVNKLVPYLTSNQGDIVFDFYLSGPFEAPAISMGPKLKEAAGMAVMGEVSTYLQGIQNLR